jgi:hypothetical protein
MSGCAGRAYPLDYDYVQAVAVRTEGLPLLTPPPRAKYLSLGF